MIRLEVGAPYPLPVAEGLVLDLFAPSGTRLTIAAPGWASEEVARLRRSAVDVKVIDAGAGLLDVEWRFAGIEHGTSPFDAHLARAAGMLEVQELGPQTGILVTILVVDTGSGVLCGIRGWTMPPEASRRAVRIVRRRLAT